MNRGSPERRRHVRAAVSLMGTIEGAGGEHPIVVLNLSAGGAMIQTHEPPQQDATYVLRFSVHKQCYELPFEVVHFVQHGDSFGWHGVFAGVSPEQAAAIDRAVHAAVGIVESSLRPWEEVAAEARREPGAKVNVGLTGAGHGITVAGRDILEMGPEGVELYARLMCELETM